MKPPVPLSPTVVTLFCVLGAAWLALSLGDSPPEHPPQPGPAAAPVPPGSAWQEGDYLLHYAEAVCLRAAYGDLEPAPSQVLEALDAESWTMVELSHQEPGVYHAIREQASAAGGGQEPASALAGCSAWVKTAAAGILSGMARADEPAQRRESDEADSKL